MLLILLLILLQFIDGFFERGNIMTKEILDRAWNMGRDIQVRYKNYKMDWVKVPKPQDEGMTRYKRLIWDLEKYEYEIVGNQ
jgi:hypothetical protein